MNWSRNSFNICLFRKCPDPTYTAVLEYCRNHQSNRGPVMYWHPYNSVDLSVQAKVVDHRNLPEPLQIFIEQKSAENESCVFT